jgi:hypothetical protein
MEDEPFKPNELRRKEALRVQIRAELAALERYEAQHGSFPALVRAHYAERGSDSGSCAD